MLNQSVVSITSGTVKPGILIDLNNTTSVSCMVSNSGVNADEKGRKIVKAGTPLKGNLEERSKAFTVATENATCVLLHDVDVTAGTANAQAVVFGFIDTNKLEESVKAMLTESVRASLSMIKFIA